MLQYMRHERHGTTIVYEEAEAVRHEKLGWHRIDEPRPIPPNPSDTLEIPKRRAARIKT